MERAGNRLPHPATLFCVAALTVMVLSQIAEALGWRVPSPGGEAGSAVSARGLLDADGLWWALSHLVENFVTFPPLGVVLVAMLGIGVAERSG
ncbi:MAG: AbgT family transporter, partial [Gammaproteobacteria bacterium]|nr:AbgT family transporter [Gammaproteobacteria bacterium]